MKAGRLLGPLKPTEASGGGGSESRAVAAAHAPGEVLRGAGAVSLGSLA